MGNGTRPFVERYGRNPQYRVIAERAFGKTLPKKAHVHHVDENGFNNRNNNLVICEDQCYHQYLHVRIRAYRETGNPNARKCSICKLWEHDLRTGIGCGSRGGAWRHRHCHRLKTRERRGGLRRLCWDKKATKVA